MVFPTEELYATGVETDKADYSIRHSDVKNVVGLVTVMFITKMKIIIIMHPTI